MPVKELALLFLRLGFTAFGGPAAHIGIMHDEVVLRRKWLGEDEFLDLLGATNLIPGPNSTEMVLHIGYRRAGWRGLVIAGLCFVTPAMLIVLALAWLYGRYGRAPQAAWLLYGVKPVVIALIAQALWKLGRQAVKDAWLLALGIVVLALYFAGLNEVLLLLGGGILYGLLRNGVEALRTRSAALLAPLAGWSGLGALAAQPVSLASMFLIFLKIGAVLYGSGYVLLAFLQRDFVARLGWLTEQQLIDAVAIGQFTPGPLFTTSTFIGYLLGGVPGALLATLGIFLPSFLFVLSTNRLIPRLREAKLTAAFLDGVNASALALMAAVTWQLGRAAILDLYTAVLAGLAMLLLFRYRINSAWLVLGGAAAGLLLSRLG